MRNVCRSFLLGCLLVSAAPAQWRPVGGHLMTRWAKEVRPDTAWPEYPRPQMVRPQWMNLNGVWEHALTPADQGRPSSFEGRILVPFPVESALSGVKKAVRPDQAVWYRRTFRIPETWAGKRVLLHFEAVDWETQVWLNGQLVGQHRGGYDPFFFEITDLLKPEAEQELVVRVWDPTDRGYQPRGKQVLEPEGIWYTAVTGIWQTVWLEPVPKAFISGFRIYPDTDRGAARFVVEVAHAPPDVAVSVRLTRLTVSEHDREAPDVSARGKPSEEFQLVIPGARFWSPSEPWLYWATVELQGPTGEVLDSVETYFGLRKVSVQKAPDGFERIFLNNRPLFQFGPLDQGWWPDGLYTAPTDKALRWDVQLMKQLAFNMVRKHVKVEPRRWYYWCDRLGLMVWQDMPSGDRFIRQGEPDIERSPESAETYWREYRAMIDHHFNHPCIVAWVPFNEGWGQFQTNEVIRWTKRYDPTRLVDGPSGWEDRGEGDMIDMHRYPGPGMPEPRPGRAAVLGEFGGLGLPVSGHLWWDKRNWGYRTFQRPEDLQLAYRLLLERLRPLIGRGLAAAIYTQLTDVEGEVNGLVTYDRAVLKLDPDQLAPWHQSLYGPIPVFRSHVLVPTSEKQPQRWRYTTTAPEPDWMKPAFAAENWQEGLGGFGRRGTPGAVIRTEWSSPEIWMRRTFALQELPKGKVALRVHHDEDAEIYINGVLAAKLVGFTTDYEEIPLDPQLLQSALRRGENVLAVHCRQTTGGQYIDVGLVELEEVTRSGPETN
jgi:hypothetical protein